MKRIILATLIITLLVLTGCTSGLTPGSGTSDDTHSFLLEICQITDTIESDTPPEGEVFLVIKYTIENLSNQNDSKREWNEQIKLQADEEIYEPVMLDSLADQMWETSLAAGEAMTGYIAYITPDEAVDFDLTFTFPVSGDEEVYTFRPVDRRIGVNADYVFTRLEQLNRTKRIPVIGGLLSAISSAPIRHFGTILVPEEEIPDLLEQTIDLPEDIAKSTIEEYLLTHGHGALE